MSLLRYALREIRRRPSRSLLTLGGITIGVATLVSVWVTSETSRQATRSMYRELGGKATIEVVSDGSTGVDPALATRLERRPDVRRAVPIVRHMALLAAPKGRSPVAVMGIEPQRDRAVRPLELTEGQGLSAENGILFEAEFARSLGLVSGGTCTLLTPQGSFDLPVVGLLKPSGAAVWNGGAVAFIRLSTAKRLFDTGDRVTAVQLQLAPGADEKGVVAALSKMLPSGLRVQDTAARAAVSDSTLLSADRGLASISVMSLVAGAFIILNTFLMSLEERRRSLAILRAIGVTKRQLVSMLLLESLLLGVIGALLGAGLGLLAAFGMKAGIEELLGLTLPGLVVPFVPFLLAGLLGPGIALAATYFPARSAARRPLLAELHPESVERSERLPRTVPWLGLGFLVLSALVSVGFRVGIVPPVFVAPATALTMVGCVLAAPVVLRPLLSIAGRAFERASVVSGRLAHVYLERHSIRTALTAGVLSLAVIVSIGMGNSIRNNLGQFEAWFKKVVPGDFFVRLAMPDIATMNAPALPARVVSDVASMPGVAAVTPVKFLRVRVGEVPAVLVARTFAKKGPPALVFSEGSAERAGTVLRHGGVVIGTLLSERLKVGPGGSIALPTDEGKKRIAVGGVITDFTAGGAAMYMEYSAARKLFGFQSPNVVVVDAAPAARASLSRTLGSYCRKRGLLLQTNAMLHASVERVIDGISGLLWSLLLLVFVVAALGVVNTLTMNVMEQTREIGVLRAVAMTRRQVARYVRSQSLLLALAGIPPGVAAGVVVAFGMHYVSRTLLGMDIPFTIDPLVAIVSAALAFVTAVVAAIRPARHAARIRVSEAVSWE